MLWASARYSRCRRRAAGGSGKQNSPPAVRKHPPNRRKASTMLPKDKSVSREVRLHVPFRLEGEGNAEAVVDNARLRRKPAGTQVGEGRCAEHRG